MSNHQNEFFLEMREEWREENYPENSEIFEDEQGSYLWTEDEDGYRKVYLPPHLQWDYQPTALIYG